nr:lysylphosphatidylglycerol synthase domain-containing protein [Rhizobium grahamii]
MSVKRVILNAFLVCGLLLAAYLLYTVFSRYSLDEIVQSSGKISGLRLVAAVGFCALSYLCLTGFDWLALQYIGKPLSYPKAAIASFTALSIGHNLGVAALSSGAVRYRYYARWGLSAEEIAKVILFCGATVGLGLSTLAGIIVLINPMDVARALRVGSRNPFGLGFFCLLLPVSYLILAGTMRSALRVWEWRFTMPSIRLAIGQVAIGTLNFICVAACLHQALGGWAEVSFVQSATAFVLANMAILLSHVPGGLGVLEAVVSAILPGAASIGGLIVFRAIYFLLPLLLGVAGFRN